MAVWGDDMSTSLPARPDLAQLRRLAKELAAAARAGEPAALDRIRAHVLAEVTLSAAQLAIAREYGFASWPRLKANVEASTMVRALRDEQFADASVSGHRGRAAALLANDPGVAGHDFRAAVVLGDAIRVRDRLARDPALATRPDPGSGCLPLIDVCRSCWHDLDSARARGITDVATLLLHAGANPDTVGSTGWEKPAAMSALDATVFSGNAALTRLLVDSGARPDGRTIDHAAARPECLRPLLEHASLPAESHALESAIFLTDTESVRLLLAAGADPNRLLSGGGFRDDPDRMHDEDDEHDTSPIHPLEAAIRMGAPVELVELLLHHGADDPSAVETLSPIRREARPRPSTPT
jgi:hypothetical protein